MKLNHKQRRRWQPLISFIAGVFVLSLFVFMVFTVWSLFMPPSDSDMTIPPLTDHERELSTALERDVRELSVDIGERNMHRPQSMEQTTDWIQRRLKQVGYRPDKHVYEVGRGIHRGKKSSNIIAELKGTALSDEVIVIGAHYDTVFNSPGANDNASAVASLLALAENFADKPLSRTVRFIFFTNEEPPFFHTPDMGSYAYARDASDIDENIICMIALDGLGFFSNKTGSQNYPVPGIGFIYPDKANFIGFVTKIGNRNLLNSVISAFRETATIPAEGAALPGFIPGVYWSDHWSFWQHDIDALLVTDTLLFRDPHYHSPNDTPERLNYDMMARVTAGLETVISHLASDY